MVKIFDIYIITVSWSLLFTNWPLILANVGVTFWCKDFLMKPMLDDLLCSFDVTLINLLYMSAIPFVLINLFTDKLLRIF